MPPGLMSHGGSDSGAILAAIDLGGGLGPALADLPGGGDNGVRVQLQALEKIHQKKVRTLMRSVAELKKRLAIATAQGKDHRRSALIRAMRTRLREQELVVDVIKEELSIKTSMGREETNDWVIRKTVGGPLRFRPKTREELQNELYRLEKKYRQALERLEARRTGGVVGAADVEQATSLCAAQSVAPGTATTNGRELQQQQQQHHEEASTKELMRLSEALEEVDALRVSVRSRDAALRAQAEAVDQLQLENRELREAQERLARKERRARDLKKKNAELGERHTALLENHEAGQEQIHHLKAQLLLRKEEAEAEADEFRELSLRQAEEVGVLLKREEELATALEEEVAARQREQREHHHNSRQVTQRAEVAEKGLLVAEKDSMRLREKNDTMVAELERLGREAAEAAGLRERGRDLALENKRLMKEAEARQARLEEARERGAVAEEALRASKEVLEAEKRSKVALEREAGEARALLEEMEALLEAERKRTEQAAEDKRRLDSLLAAERQKGDQMGVAAAEAAAVAADDIAIANAATSAAVAQAAAAEKAKEEAVQAKDQAVREKDEAEKRRKTGEGSGEGTRNDLTESDEIIKEMEADLREHVEEKRALGVQLEAAKKMAEQLRAANSLLTARLDAAASTAAADAELEAASPGFHSRRRPVHPSTSADDEERDLWAELAAAKVSEKAAKDACVALKLELDDALASCELQKNRVKDLLAKRVSGTIADPTSQVD